MKHKLAITIILATVIQCLAVFGNLSNAAAPTNTDGFNKISAGSALTMAIKNDGTLWAWGNNYEGQSNGSSTPFQIKGIADVKAISVRWDNAVALKNDGTVWAFQIGFHHAEATTNLTIAPVQVKELSNVTAISAGIYRTLALKEDGTVWEWGIYSNSSYTKYGSPTPIQVKGIKDIVSISSGYSHSVAVDKSGTVWEWGYEDEGFIPEGATNYNATPVKIDKLTNITSVSTGGSGGNMVRIFIHSLALKNDGTVWRAESGDYLPSGYGTENESKSFAQIKGLSNVVAISTGGYLGVALKNDGTVWVIDNSYDDNGKIIENNLVHQVKGLNNIVAVSAGYSHVVALRKDGAVLAWGNNDGGQLGIGTNKRTETPAESLINLGTQTGIQIGSLPNNQNNPNGSSSTTIKKSETAKASPALIKLTLSLNSIKLKKGKTMNLKAYAHYSNGTKVDVTNKITWSWGNSKIASYKNGVIKANLPGKCISTATYKSTSCKLSIVVVN